MTAAWQVVWYHRPGHFAAQATRQAAQRQFHASYALLQYTTSRICEFEKDERQNFETSHTFPGSREMPSPEEFAPALASSAEPVLCLIANALRPVGAYQQASCKGAHACENAVTGRSYRREGIRKHIRRRALRQNTLSVGSGTPHLRSTSPYLTNNTPRSVAATV